MHDENFIKTQVEFFYYSLLKHFIYYSKIKLV